MSVSNLNGGSRAPARQPVCPSTEAAGQRNRTCVVKTKANALTMRCRHCGKSVCRREGRLRGATAPADRAVPRRDQGWGPNRWNWSWLRQPRRTCSNTSSPGEGGVTSPVDVLTPLGGIAGPTGIPGVPPFRGNPNWFYDGSPKTVLPPPLRSFFPPLVLPFVPICSFPNNPPSADQKHNL